MPTVRPDESTRAEELKRPCPAPARPPPAAAAENIPWSLQHADLARPRPSQPRSGKSGMSCPNEKPVHSGGGGGGGGVGGPGSPRAAPPSSASGPDRTEPRLCLLPARSGPPRPLSPVHPQPGPARPHGPAGPEGQGGAGCSAGSEDRPSVLFGQTDLPAGARSPGTLLSSPPRPSALTVTTERGGQSGSPPGAGMGRDPQSLDKWTAQKFRTPLESLQGSNQGLCLWQQHQDTWNRPRPLPGGNHPGVAARAAVDELITASPGWGSPRLSTPLARPRSSPHWLSHQQGPPANRHLIPIAS
ncbi:proline-rich protein 2-like [Tachyglossus aculeatus]|uniref:proline-rich protein 2-like n=1 Tax=Tachyglossus aculeatus TaxID=9261 RepID=UPI0018F5E872|nr:proline-rich protein 2-like [Tachyglossus aculeatus]